MSKFLFHFQNAIMRFASIVLLTALAVFFAMAFGFLMGEEFALFGGGVVLVMAAIVKSL